MKEIEIKSSQGVGILYELASLGERIIAALIDLVLIGLLYGILQWVVSRIAGMLGIYIPGVTLVVLFLTTYVGYHFLYELLNGGQSLGKKIIGLRVVQRHGARFEVIDLLLRSVFTMVDHIFTLGLLGILSVFTSPIKQRFGDLLADSVVIRVGRSRGVELSSFEKLDQLTQEDLKYEGLRVFSEEDMLTLKKTLIQYKQSPNKKNQELLDILVLKSMEKLGLKETPEDKLAFLKDLLIDYVKVTR